MKSNNNIEECVIDNNGEEQKQSKVETLQFLAQWSYDLIFT